MAPKSLPTSTAANWKLIGVNDHGIHRPQRYHYHNAHMTVHHYRKHYRQFIMFISKPHGDRQKIYNAEEAGLGCGGAELQDHQFTILPVVTISCSATCTF